MEKIGDDESTTISPSSLKRIRDTITRFWKASSGSWSKKFPSRKQAEAVRSYSIFREQTNQHVEVNRFDQIMIKPGFPRERRLRIGVNGGYSDECCGREAVFTPERGGHLVSVNIGKTDIK